MAGRRINNKQLARMKALSDLGYSPKSISRRLQMSHHTIAKYLKSEIINSPEVKELVSIIKEKEIDELYLLGAKARKRLHELLDEGNTKVIETTAVVDRTFQQRQLLEGKATQIFDISRHGELEAKAKELAQRIIELKKIEAVK